MRDDVYIHSKFIRVASKKGGTQLAAGRLDGVVVVWNYPSGDVSIEDNAHTPGSSVAIAWNPFNRDVLATHLTVSRCVLRDNYIRPGKFSFCCSTRERYTVLCYYLRQSFSEGKSEVFFWSLSATEKHITNQLEWNSLIFSVSWVSENRIACSAGNTISIHQIDGTSTKIVKQYKHQVSRVECKFRKLDQHYNKIICRVSLPLSSGTKIYNFWRPVQETNVLRYNIGI